MSDNKQPQNPSKQPHRRFNRFKRKFYQPEATTPKPEGENRWPGLNNSLDVGPFTVFDIETTGGNPEKNAITEIAALRYENGTVVDSFYSLVNPQIPIPPIVRRMTGLNNKMLKDEPLIAEVMPKFVEFIGDSVLVSHNTIGDVKFLRHFSQQTNGKAIPNFYICTHLLVEKLIPEAPNKSLRGLAQSLKLTTTTFHRAQDDAEATLQLFQLLIERLKKRNLTTLDAAIRFQGDLESGIRLGWNVDFRKIAALPQAPGVFCLHDKAGKILFFSSALNLKREVKRLLKFDQVPRPLLRIVLSSYDITFEEVASHFDAVLRESELLATKPTAFSSLTWHQRAIQCIHLATVDGQIKIGVGPIVPGTVAAFGPISDRKVARTILARLSRAFPVDDADKHLVFPKTCLRPLMAYFANRLEAEIKSIEVQSKKFLTRILGFGRRGYESQLQFVKVLHEMGKIPESLEPILDLRGLVAVPTTDRKGSKVLAINRGCIDKTTVIAEPVSTLTKSPQFRRELERLTTANEMTTEPALSQEMALQANSILWWIHAQVNRNDGRFFSREDLDHLNK